MHKNNNKLVDRFKQFLIKQDLAEISIKGYLQDLKVFKTWLISFYQEEASLLEVSINDLRAFRESSSKIKRQKPSTINRRIQVVKRFYQWASQTNLIQNNPAEKLRFIPRMASYKPVALTQKEVHALLRAAGLSSHGLSKRNYALVQLIVQAGLRIGEVVSLQMRDLVLHERSGLVRIVGGKGRKYREVPLNATARRALINYLETRGKLSLFDHIFVSKRGVQAGIRTLQKIIQSIFKRTSIRRVQVTAHTLRHTFAVHYLQANPNGIIELARLMGHESINTTSIYTKVSQEKLAANIESSEINIYSD